MRGTSTMKLCDNINRLVNFKLDLVGLATLLGGDVVVSAMRVRCLNNNRADITFYNVPGGLLLASSILACGESRICRILAGGKESDIFNLIQVNSSCRFKASYLDAAQLLEVTNVLGENVLLEYMNRCKYREYDWRRMNDDQLTEIKSREEVVGILGSSGITIVRLSVEKCITRDNIEFNSYSCTASACIATLVNMSSITVCIVLGQYFVFSVLLLGAMLNCAMTLRIKKINFNFLWSSGSHREGRLLIKDTKTPNAMFVIQCSNNYMQTLFTKQLMTKEHGMPVQLLILSLLMYVNVVISIVGVANVSLCGQLVFGITVIAGATSELIRSGWNFRKYVTSYAESEFGVKCMGKKVFGNKLAAVAYIACDTKDIQALKSMKLLPVSDNWKQYWEVLGMLYEHKGSNVAHIIDCKLTRSVCIKMGTPFAALDVRDGVQSYMHSNVSHGA